MGFAVILCFEPEAEARLQGLWQALAEGGINSTMVAAGFRPHITLGGFDGAPPKGLCEELQQLVARTPPLTVAFSGIGVFPTEEVLYLAPVVTMELLELQARLRACLAGLGVAQPEHYQPGHWVPHCTLAIGLPPEKIAGVLDLCRRHDAFAPARAAEIVLVETTPVGSVCTLSLGQPHPK